MDPLELCLLTASIIPAIWAIRDPNPNMNSEDKIKEESYPPPWLVRIVGTGIPTGLITPLVILFDAYLAPGILWPGPNQTFAPMKIDKIRVGAYVLFIAGGAFRIWAVRVLGKFFTVKVCVRPNHKLIRSPPYNIVRHPSYTGVTMMAFGVALVFSRGSTAKYVSPTHWSSFSWIWALAYTYVFMRLTVLPRVPTEEQVLEDEFKSEWAVFKREVPYRVFPCIW